MHKQFIRDSLAVELWSMQLAICEAWCRSGGPDGFRYHHAGLNLPSGVDCIFFETLEHDQPILRKCCDECYMTFWKISKDRRTMPELGAQFHYTGRLSASHQAAA